MVRKIIQIDKEKCNGCGACANACHEGAIAMLDGKAHLIRDDYCDGLGDCLPTCPTGAITFVEREAAPYDEEAVKANQKKALPCGCPGTQVKQIRHREHMEEEKKEMVSSELTQWPVQIKLVPIQAPYFEKADLLIAADCTAYAYGAFHQKFMKNKVTLIGCPKLDAVDYAEKLTEILKNNNIKSVTVIRMEVPCCGGIENAVKNALKESNHWIPWNIVTITTDGKIKE